MFAALPHWPLIMLLLMVASGRRATAQQPIFPALSGTVLLDSLRAGYKPASGLNYAQARDTLYRNIMAENDSLTCLYSGYRIHLPPGQDPTQAAFDAGVNTEHIYPRSKGAEDGMARSDMHHIFPSRINVNDDRADLPFGEVPDQQTIAWYFQSQKQSTVPNSNIDAFSELGSNRFEPRESVKGDVARAMFYFYTMYRSEAELADRDFFPDQRATLCDWHRLDPVDTKEWERNAAIAPYQDGKANPYILDCTLAFRAFCPDLPLPDCGFTAVSGRDRESKPFLFRGGTPNPFSGHLALEYELYDTQTVALLLTDVLGRPLQLLVNSRQQTGRYRLALDATSFPPGIYYLQMRTRTSKQIWFQAKKLIKH